jgi:uncharacterized membrane protein
MTYASSNMITLITVLLVLMAVGYVSPLVARKGVVFGVQLGPRTAPGEIARLFFRFKVSYIVAQFFFLVMVAYLYALLPSQQVMLAAVIIQVLLSFTILIIHNIQAAKLKQNAERSNEAAYMAVDSRPRPVPVMLGKVWYLPALVLVLLNLILPVLAYDTDPVTAIRLSIPGLLVILASLIVSYSIQSSKQELDPNQPRTSSVQDQVFRFRWSAYMIAFSIILTGFGLLVSLQGIQAIHIPPLVMLVLNLVLLIATLIVPLVIALKTGQAGSLVQTGIQEADQGRGELDLDAFWKYGLVYFNRHDPAFFIAKRMGIGWTVNFGNPLVSFVLLLFVIFLILIDSLLT